MTKNLLRCGVVAALSLGLGAQTLLIPAAANGADLPSSTGWPFDYGSPIRILYVYDSSHFTAGGITSPVLINRIRIRANATTTTWVADTIANVTVDLSTAPLDYAVISGTYDSNHGADRAQVYNAALGILPGSATAGTPGPFHIDIPVTPFLYDPNQGDLTVDIISSGVPNTTNSPLLDTSSTTGVALARRVYGLSYAGATTGTIWSGESAPAIEFSYVPAAGVSAAFSATPRSGASPLTVQFTDSSYTSDPGGIVAWAWDFDNDGNVDSTAQNPSHVYGCGDFTVSLTVTAANGQDTETRASYISTDVTTADFTFALQMAPNVWQFTDASSPTPTAWSWDFDGDNIPDSTLQNPVWAFPVGCSLQNVRLDVTRNCRTANVAKSLLVAPASLSANLTAGTGTLSATDVGNLFDVQVLTPEGITVCALDSLTYTGTGPYTVSVYVTEDTYVGKESTAAAWRLVATGGAVAGPGTVSAPSINLCQLNAPFHLPAGNHGIAVYHRAASGSAYIAYTNASSGPFANADLSIHPNPATAPGISRTTLFGTSGFSPRQWNGTFYYSKCSLTGAAGYGFFGSGCAGSLPVSSNVGTSWPQLGGSMVSTFDNLPTNAAVFLLGFSRTTSPFGSLPLDLTSYGATGCFGRVSPDATSFLFGSGGTASNTLGIPNIPSLLCAQVYTQALVLDPAANVLGAVVSDAAAAIVGQ